MLSRVPSTFGGKGFHPRKKQITPSEFQESSELFPEDAKLLLVYMKKLKFHSKTSLVQHISSYKNPL